MLSGARTGSLTQSDTKDAESSHQHQLHKAVQAQWAHRLAEASISV